MNIYMIMASKGGKAWLVQHAYSGPAIFFDVNEAAVQIEATKATGIEYRVIEMAANELLKVMG